MRKQIVNNLASNYLASLVQMVLGFLIVPFLVTKLGKDAFGIIVLAESLIAFSQVLNVSIRIALSRHATFSLSQGKREEFIRYLSTGRCILWLSMVVVLVLGLIISFNFPSLFKVPLVYAQQSRVLFLLITITFAISIPNDVFWTVLYANQRFDLINMSSSGAIILRAVSIFALYTFLPARYANLGAYGLIYLTMTWGQNFMVYLWSMKIMPGVKITFKKFQMNKVREILSYSGHTSLSAVSFMLYENTMNVIINLCWGPSSNAVYSVSVKLPALLRRLFLEPSSSLTPSFTHLAARNDRSNIDALFFIYSKAMVIVTIPMVFLLVMFSKEIIYAWVGPGFSLAAELMPFYAISALMTVPVSVCFCLIHAYGKVKVQSRISFATALGNVILATTLGLGFQMGLKGIAIAALTVAMTGTNVILPFYACKVSGLSIKKYWVDSILKPLILALFLMEGGILVWKLMGLSTGFSFLTFVYYAFLSSAFYIIAYFFLLNEKEKTDLRKSLNALLGTLQKPWTQPLAEANTS